MSAERALSRERVRDTGFSSFIRKVLDTDILELGKRQKAKKREMEFSVAYDEGKELQMQYGLEAPISRSGEVFFEFKNQVIKEGRRILFEDPRMIIDVSNEAFGKIVTDREIPYVCQETENHNNPDRSAETTVFATTEKNLRIKTKMKKENTFYKDVIFPSFVAQRTRQVDLLRGRETTPAEINDLDRKAGYAAVDISANYPVAVRKIRLLSPAEAQKFMGGGLPSYNVKKDNYLANRY